MPPFCICPIRQIEPLRGHFTSEPYLSFRECPCCFPGRGDYVRVCLISFVAQWDKCLPGLRTDRAHEAVSSSRVHKTLKVCINLELVYR